MITIALSDGSTVVVRSSIAPRQTSKKEVDEINRYLDNDSDATPRVSRAH